MSARALPPLRSLDPVQATLPNGLRVLAVPQPHLQSASLSVFVKVGPRHERVETNGISHFLEHMLFRGTARFETPYQLSFAAEALGGMIDAATYADFTHYQITVPSEHVQPALELLADLFAAPRFEQLALEKDIVKEEILADLDADGREVDAENLSRMLVFAGHPLGFKITGDAANVERFTLDDLREHLRAHYGAANMVVVATGAVDPHAFVKLADACFGAFATGQLTLVDQPPPPRHEQRLQFVKNDASQSEVRLCFRAFGSDDPDYVALKVLMRVLDDGMSTRLHQKLTDQSGLAYEVFAALDPYEETGVVELGASVTHDKVSDVLRELLALLSELRDSDVTADELEKARTRYHWSLRRIVDSAEDMALFAGTQVLFGRSVALSALLHEVERVTCADVRRVARRVARPENAYVVCVGRIARSAQKKAERVLAEWRAQSARALSL